MCGIAGVISRQPVQPKTLAPALEALRHRGPDDSGLVELTGQRGLECHLAHTRLSILDLSARGHQPMSDANGRYMLVFNGEIYNYRDLRRELEARGHRFLSQTDSEVLLHAWKEWGTAALSWLRGFFAFAVFDRETGSLVLARDRLGIKPLYYVERPAGIAFASEVRALLAAGLAERKIDKEGLESYLAYGSVSEPRTIIAGVRALPPGTWLRWSGKVQTGRFWSAPIEEAPAPLRFDEAVEQVRGRLSESVRLRLVADVPVGVFLSGGIDSSVIAALAAKQSSRPVRTFTVSFDQAAYDEDRFARMVADRFGCEHQTIPLHPDRAAAEVDDAVAALDQPSADGLNTYFVSKATREAGVTVALSGLGGDELFAGYRNFRLIRNCLRAGRFAPARSFGVAERVVANRGRFLLPNAVTKSLALGSEARTLPGIYSVMRALFTDGQRQALFGHGGAGSRFLAWPSAELQSEADRRPVSALSALELCNYLKNTLLRDTDAMSMASALEVRVPLLDHRLVELVLSLPDALKLASPGNKALLAAVVPELPREAVTRKKMGFTLPFDTWFRGALRPWMEERLFGGGLFTLAEPRSLERLWAGYLRGERYVSHSRVWSLAVLARWCEINRCPLGERTGTGEVAA